MADESKRKLRFATIVYWILLFYIIAALLWWAFSLERQNEMMYQLRKEHLISVMHNPSEPAFIQELSRIEDIRKRNIAKYIGEGTTFLFLILFGAVFIYRSVRRQFQLSQQQQNFVMAVTHELKTPIAVSRLNLETLLRHQLDEQRKEKLVQMTLQETLRLDTLINNILLSLQLEGHSYSLIKEELDLSELVQSVASQFSQRYPDRKLQTMIQHGLDFDGDPILLKLLVSNLLENAHKYAPKDKPVTLVLNRKENRVCMEVRDEGPGIEPKERKNIFKKFYRLGNEQTRKSKGTGLGLYLCKKIVEDHHGTISVTDNHPQGSNFIVLFIV